MDQATSADGGEDLEEATLLKAVADDYAGWAGKVVVAHEIKVFLDESFEVTGLGDVPALVRVDRGQESGLAEAVAQRCDDEWCDPEYAATLLEPHPGIPAGASVFLEARSRSKQGREEGGGKWRFAAAPESVALRFPEPAPDPETDEGYARFYR